MDYSTDLRQVFSEAGMQGGLQIGLTEGQGVQLSQSSPVQSSRVDRVSLARSLDKELVERDLDRTLSTYTKY